MPDRETGNKERNWYKLATIVLSFAMVVITFISGVYYRHLDEGRRQEDTAKAMIYTLLQRKAELSGVPKVRVELLTLEKSGLPSSAFRSLKEIPAVLRIRHVGGATARGITVEITSSCEVTQFLPEVTIEQFSHQVSSDRKSVRIDIPQLRTASTIEGTVMCSSIGTTSCQTRVDIGVLLDGTESEKRDTQKILSISDIEQIDPASLKSEREIDSRVESIRQFQQMTSRPGGTGWASMTFAIAAFLFGPVYFMAYGAYSYRRGRRHHFLGDRIIGCMREETIRTGMSESEVMEVLGSPQSIVHMRRGGAMMLKWSYTPRPSFFFRRESSTPGGGSRWEPDVFITWKDNKVLSCEYHTY